MLRVEACSGVGSNHDDAAVAPGVAHQTFDVGLGGQWSGAPSVRRAASRRRGCRRATAASGSAG